MGKCDFIQGGQGKAANVSTYRKGRGAESEERRVI